VEDLLLVGAVSLRQLSGIEVEVRLSCYLLRACGSQVLSVPGVVEDVTALGVFDVDVIRQVVYQSAQLVESFEFGYFNDFATLRL
jgi:hypothetical protein